MITVKSFSLVKERVADFAALIDKDTIAVVRPEKALENLLRSLIQGTVAAKRPVGDAFEPLESYFRGLSAVPAYQDKVTRTLGTLETYLSEGMSIQADLQAVEDYVLARCTRLCAEALAAAAGLPVIDGTQLVVCRTDAPKPYFDWDASRVAIADACHGGMVVAGGYAREASGRIVRIGRGGAHMMASLIASAVQAGAIEFFSSSPFGGSGSLTYDEAAHYCAVADAPFPSASLWPAKKAGIPILVKDIATPTAVVARISSEAATQAAASPVSGIVAEKDLELVTVLGTGLLGQVGLSSGIFSALAAQHVNIRFISQSSSEYSISFAVRHEDSDRVVAAMEDLVSGGAMLPLDDVMVLNQRVGIITIFGSRMKNVPGTSGRVYAALGEAGVNIIASAQGGEELSISLVVNESDLDTALKALK
ncbi:MAG: ACT domain-containing protein [Bacteroidota bacterium]|nr:ACT domain-containing protein [Bacteroidota bacterium]